MAIQRFLTYLLTEKRFSPNTIKSYNNDLNQFELFLETFTESPSINEANHIMIRSWMVNLLEKGQKPRSVNRKISSLRSFYNYLKKQGEIKNNPTLKVIRPKMEKRLPEFLKDSEINALLDSMAFLDDFEGQRDRLVIEILYTCGLRRAELLGLKVKDINLEGSQIKVLGKGNKERIIPIPKSTVDVIEGYMSSCEDIGYHNEYLILTDKGIPAYPKLIYNIVNKYLSQISTLKKRSPHVLRHSFATHLTNNGAELNAVKELLGHASLAATQVYTHNSIEKLKEVYKKAHPKAE